MPNLIRGTVGEDVPIRPVTRERRSDSEDGRRFDPNGAWLKKIVDEDGNDVTGGATFTQVTSGEFVAFWDTSTLDPGFYEAEIEIAHGWDTVNDEREIHRADTIILLEEAT